MSDPYENFEDPYDSRREKKFLAARSESKMLAAIASGFFTLGTLVFIFQPSAEPLTTAFQGLLICSYTATTVIGGWSFLRYVSVADPAPASNFPLTKTPLPWASAIGQLIAGFVLGVLAWLTVGLTLLVAAVLVVGSVAMGRIRCGFFIAGTILGAIFPPLALFSICYFSK